MTRFRTQMLAVPLALSGVLAVPVAEAAQASGETVYGRYCTTCHDATDGSGTAARRPEADVAGAHSADPGFRPDDEHRHIRSGAKTARPWRNS